MLEKYSIKSRSHCCSQTGAAFSEDQPFVAAIFPDPESSGYLRRDYCLDAWKELKKELSAEEINPERKPFSFWKSVYRPPVKEEEIAVTKDDPEQLFIRLVEEDQEHTENARFILAAMLERKKLIRETDTQQLPSGLLRVYEHRKTGDVFIVKDPQIALSDVESVQEEVHQLLTADHPPIVQTHEQVEPPPQEQTEAAILMLRRSRKSKHPRPSLRKARTLHPSTLALRRRKALRKR